MDTRESKTPEEEKQHIINERVPEDYETSKPHLQPEAKKRPDGLYKLLPLVVIILGVIVVSIVVLGIINRGN
ncbi:MULTISPECIES: hypothetical protein [unclassified Halomonas]|uniref:hypothetical protein n=1 Tax=unclassified Halomonas TaxID=2609666 RepID=UPI001CF5E1C7|nr:MULTISPECIES: hypothetical protein [unclassified Halomonas]MCA8863433.1 hypothetical protein [Halomonas sp. SBBP1]UZH08751.1 hypothetical protein OM794_15485 [Halomonas sp. BDJS001]